MTKTLMACVAVAAITVSAFTFRPNTEDKVATAAFHPFTKVATAAFHPFTKVATAAFHPFTA